MRYTLFGAEFIVGHSEEIAGHGIVTKDESNSACITFSFIGSSKFHIDTI